MHPDAGLLEDYSESFLGYALIRNEEAFEIAGRLGLVADDFCRANDKTLWAAMLAKYSSAGGVDMLTVREELGAAKLRTLRNSYIVDLAHEASRSKITAKSAEERVVAIKAAASRRRAELAAIAHQKRIADGMAAGESVRILAAESGELSTPQRPRLEVVSIRDVEPRTINWLWRPYLALGMLHILNGDAYAGKTFIAMALSAGITLGRMPLSTETCAPGNVLYLQAENPEHEVMAPRFRGLGGDLDRFKLIRGSVWSDGRKLQRRPITLSDLDQLEEAFAEHRPRLLVIDPFQGYIGSGVDMYRANEVRPIMEGLGRIAGEYQTAVLLMRHFAKGSVGVKAMHRGMGSVDFTNVARSELFAGILPGEDGIVPRGGSGPRALVHGASNIGLIGESLEYRISNEGIFGWVGKLDIDLDQLMNASSSDGEGSRALREACDFLRAFLTPNSQNSKDVEKAARQCGVSARTLRRAKLALKVRSRKTSVAGGWIWFLPGCGTEKEDGSGPIPVQ